MSPSLDLAGRVVLVTGGTRGIGVGISEAFLDAGATVVTCSRSEVEPLPGTSHRVCDVRDPDAVAALVRGLVADHGRLDVLVNNAGGTPPSLAAEASPRFHSKVVELNLLAPLLMAQAVNAVMQEQAEGGVILNISSVSALRPSPGTAAYGAAKAGLDSLTGSLAVEWGPKVRLNSLDVGRVLTDAHADHLGSDQSLESVEASVPLGRLARPRDIGDVCLLLASPLASYVTGATLRVDGGGERPAWFDAHPSTKEHT